MTDLTPKCKCGKPAVMRKYKDGRPSTSMGACHDCITERMRNGKTRKDKKKIERKVIKGNSKITLDFTNYPDIYNKLVEKAKTEMRTIESQIIYSLRTV